MSDHILEERGLFWPNNRVVPANQFAPDDAVTGTMRIRPDGVARLELDGTLTRLVDRRAAAAWSDEPIPPLVAVQGLLRTTHQHVLLNELAVKNRTFSSNNLHHESYSALTCLVSRHPFKSGLQTLACRSWTADISDLQAWIRNSRTSATRRRGRLTFDYRAPPARRFREAAGILTLKHEARGGRRKDQSWNEHSLSEHVLVGHAYRTARQISEIKDALSNLEHLLILLSGHAPRANWPLITTWTGAPCTLYYARLQPPSGVEYYDTQWTSFSEVESEFGRLYSTWASSYKTYGPGFHLYTGTVRRSDMYTEHHFMNLMWGLESFHRTKFGSVPASKAIVDKVERVVNAAAAGDRRWLAGQLRNAAEPALEARLRELIGLLPTTFDSKRLKSFCKSCAQHRNDISHFGGVRAGGSYQALVSSIVSEARALERIYRGILMLEIGTEPDLVRRSFQTGIPSGAMKWFFRDAGLVS